jgi:hypothetical protein
MKLQRIRTRTEGAHVVSVTNPVPPILNSNSLVVLQCRIRFLLMSGASLQPAGEAVITVWWLSTTATGLHCD